MDFFDWRESRGEKADVETEQLATLVIGAAIEVHRHLGAGHLEKFYQRALCRELQSRGIQVACEVEIKINYKGECLGVEKIDLVVAGKLIVELKSVQSLTDVHSAQALGYLAATGMALALLINFNVPILKQGIKRIVLDQKHVPSQF